MRVAEALRHGGAWLAGAGLETPRLDARLLLGRSTGLTREALLRDPDRRIDPVPFDALLTRRAHREPLALILGEQEFWSLVFTVTPATLIPRPDSETLIEAALEAMPDRSAVRRVLDLGTGSGCLLLAALSEFPDAWGLGVDRSAAAAAVATGNAAALGLSPRASFVVGDWGACLGAPFDLVLCNPPYIPRGEIVGLMPEVARFEPLGALDGGDDGLAAYRAVLAVLPGLVAPGGIAVLELGIDQWEPVQALAGQAGVLRRDLAGIPRALVLRA